MSIEAQLEGGPEDGTIIRMPDLRKRWRMPTTARRSRTSIAEDPIDRVIPIADYDLMLTDGRPSVNDTGQYRFEFVGYE